ncbi:MAG: aldo/keto reductase [Acidimicrobiales bacterium]
MRSPRRPGRVRTANHRRARTKRHRLRTVFPADDWRSGNRTFTGEPFRRNRAVVDELRSVASLRGASVGQLAVAWTLANLAVEVAIVGSRRPGHLREPAATLDRGRPGRDRLDHGRRRAHGWPDPGGHAVTRRHGDPVSPCATQCRQPIVPACWSPLVPARWTTTKGVSSSP